jgi:hypothetical protein
VSLSEPALVEIVGRHRLIQELLGAGLEVAVPQRDRGIDLIAYVDRDSRVSNFVAVPIQMKAATGRSFSIATKYSKFPNLLLAYVWGLGTRVQPVTYAMTHPEALAVGDGMGWTKTDSWKRGLYTTQQPSRKLLGLLDAHRMTPEKWWNKVTGAAYASARRSPE